MLKKGTKVRFKLYATELKLYVDHSGYIREVGNTTYLVSTDYEISHNSAAVHMVNFNEVREITLN